MVINSGTFSSDDLLIYDPNHSVLICRECKYAIQKSALGSHLLRHKIYRGERQRLLTSIALLKILEPDDVQLPPAGSLPVDGLPVISGYRCQSPSCDSLYASSKRMRRHWSETHGISDPPDSFSSPVHLQTFFKGTKLRYFEVAAPSSSAASTSTSSTAEPSSFPGAASSSASTSTNHNFNIPPPTSQLPPFPQPSPSPFPPPNPPPSSTLSPTIDLTTLQYFHHYTTTTSQTLPLPNHDPTKKTHWPLDVVRLALSLHNNNNNNNNNNNPSYLTAGLLALSASHHASLAPNIPTTKIHLTHSSRFFQEFMAGWTELKHNFNISRLDEARVAAQIICIQRCCHWLFTDWNVRESFQLRSFTRTVQGCVDGNLALRGVMGSEEVPEEVLLQGQGQGQGVGAMGMGMGVDMTGGPGGSSSAHGGSRGGINAIQGRDPQDLIPRPVLDRIRGLTLAMSDTIGKPDSAMDFFATLSATDLILECCQLSYLSDGMEAGWLGMDTWLRRVTEHLATMVAMKKPAGLVVVAHWSLLLERTERDCWFLKGSAGMVRRQVLAELPRDNPGVMGLVVNWPVVG